MLVTLNYYDFWSLFSSSLLFVKFSSEPLDCAGEPRSLRFLKFSLALGY
jgi:hypothetical protein